MHDQCHRLNNHILTFLANFVKVQSGGGGQNKTKEDNFENLFNIAVGFLHTVKIKTKIKQQQLTNSKVCICKTFVCEFCGHAFHS